MCFLFLAAVKNQAAGFQIVWSREIVEWVSAPDTALHRWPANKLQNHGLGIKVDFFNFAEM